MENVLILGGGSRMGLATARILLQNGYQVILSSRTKEKLLEATQQLGTGASYFVADASVSSELEAMLGQLTPVSHIVVTVCANANASSINNTAESDARQAFERFWISYNALHFAPTYLTRTGSVTLISGSSAKTPAKRLGVWGTLHGSINALVKQAAIDNAPIRVNSISPGGISIQTSRQLAEHRGQVEDVASNNWAPGTDKVFKQLIRLINGRLRRWYDFNGPHRLP